MILIWFKCINYSCFINNNKIVCKCSSSHDQESRYFLSDSNTIKSWISTWKKEI